uniref:Tetratricopeptide repeat protein n=1 Tax=Chlamydomonas leiostraca TaxID=1034604 RepID=A0A7S0WNV8_9CHLO|mmetsp:Transcript_21168/g.53810  ORF Transcript_21168/g.53810 Transcript_21168/m.53810 type:complete len:215 (+) Transcript_21168:265-909(+)|eukprot:CAMPEP_0202858628 /NCGR_PEP_ID=MMETSP1391-20130828/1076_1 /ASSEMBLY_ACC=CAM_ASM_000867 /TAXON_ID=1034604 /ORGANISM="Chlamydomonas leiostraca, Strain SAG 11-49" /LENGTH=214 /DNA_ID=CAMNT_0049537561 /DNA_START=265 /DNA_END=909 /DNA_ORIENTATION=-
MGQQQTVQERGTRMEMPPPSHQFKDHGMQPGSAMTPAGLPPFTLPCCTHTHPNVCGTTTAATGNTSTTTTGSTSTSTSSSSASTDAAAMYERALEAARARDYAGAVPRFEALLAAHPGHGKAWISYAQMQKARLARVGKEAGWDACRSVLARGAAANPANARIVQAAGLLELQAGRTREAVPLLEQAVRMDPGLSAVLEWQAVKEARRQQQSRS